METGREEGRNKRGKNLSIFGTGDEKDLSENSETRDTKTAVNIWDSGLPGWPYAQPFPKTNESDTVQMYRNIFYLGNMSQNRSVSKIDSREYGHIYSPTSPKNNPRRVRLSLPPWAPLV